VGVVVSALALGLAAVVLLLLSLGGLVAALGAAHLVVMLGVVPIYLALAGWALGTLVGLLRMRSGARISAMVIAGCMAGLGLLFTASLMAIQTAIASGQIPMPPIATPAEIHRAFTLMAWLCVVMSALGIAGLVYFAQRSTRDAFLQARAHQLTAHAAYSPSVAHAQPSGPAWLLRRPQPAPNPLTDFTVARPIEPPAQVGAAAAEPQAETTFDPTQQPWPSAQAEASHPAEESLPASAWPAYPQYSHTASGPAATVRRGRPVSVTIVAMVSLANAFFTLVGVVAPVPGFLFGMVVSGWPLHLYSLVWTAAAAIAGLGMLRLQRPAWLLSFVLLGISSLQFLVLLLPAARARYIHYMSDVQPHSGLGNPQGLPAGMLSLTIVLGMLMGLGVLALFAVMLWRARWAFEPTAPPASEEPHIS